MLFQNMIKKQLKLQNVPPNVYKENFNFECLFLTATIEISKMFVLKSVRTICLCV